VNENGGIFGPIEEIMKMLEDSFSPSNKDAPTEKTPPK
jgi:hypothetical protein